MNIQKLIAQTTMALALTLMLAAPAAAATISGNGYRSTNRIRTTLTNMTSVFQNNNVRNKTTTYVAQDSGDNEITKNTGSSENEIETGENKVEAEVTNVGGENVNEGDDCGCPDHEVEAEISDNGAKSRNTIDVRMNHRSTLKQTNRVSNTTKIMVNQNSGDNTIKGNVGSDSNNSILSGPNSAHIDVFSSGGMNHAM